MQVLLHYIALPCITLLRYHKNSNRATVHKQGDACLVQQVKYADSVHQEGSRRCQQESRYFNVMFGLCADREINKHISP